MSTNELSSLPAGSEWVPFGMQSAAIFLAVFHDVLAIVALILCVKLFCRHRQIGWLLIIPIFVAPLYMLIVHALKGEPLIYYRSERLLPDGALQVSYKWDLPVFYFISVIGLFLLARQKGDGHSEDKSTESKLDKPDSK